jgi:hypothetical protein
MYKESGLEPKTESDGRGLDAVPMGDGKGWRVVEARDGVSLIDGLSIRKLGKFVNLARKLVNFVFSSRF